VKSIRLERAAGSIPLMPWPNKRPFDPIDVGRSFADQTLTLAMGAACVLLFECRHTNDGADMLVAAIEGNQGAQQHQHIDPIRLHPTSATVDLETRRVEDAASNARRLQLPREPETIVSGLVTDDQAIAVARGGEQLRDEIADGPPLIRWMLGWSRSGRAMATIQLFLLSSMAAYTVGKVVAVP
jgi:hypothetical protein